MENTENAIEFISGQKTATVSFTDRGSITKIKKLYEKYPDEFEYLVENEDGSICAKVPKRWVAIRHPKVMSDESKQAASERLKLARAKATR